MNQALPYPLDRVDGFVQLTDGNGHAFVPDMAEPTGNIVADALRYCRAFMTLARRMSQFAA